MVAAPASKISLRRELRALRRTLPDRRGRSERIAERLLALPEVAAARRVLLFDAVPGEPAMASLRDALDARGVETAVPEDDVDSIWPDVVIVPGVAFTAAGDRLGQGGGWYDRFLPLLRPECVTIGVAFAEQVVDTLPVESHDVRVDHVVTDG